MSKRISRHVGKILDDVLSTCHLAGWDDIFFPMSGRHSRHFADMPTCVGTTCHLGGCWRRDMMPTFPTKLIIMRIYSCGDHVHQGCPSLVPRIVAFNLFLCHFIQSNILTRPSMYIKLNLDCFSNCFPRQTFSKQ